MDSDLEFFLGEFWEALSVAESSGDLAHVAPMCAEDLTFISQAKMPCESLEDLIAVWWTPPSGYRITFDTMDVVSSGEMAIGRGIATDSFTTEDGIVGGHRYNYLAVFGKRAVGWRLTHFISNLID